MDTKLSCYILGVLGIVFGLLAILVPGVTLATFYTLFWVIDVAGIVLFLVIAITSRADESMMWFVMSAVLLIIGAFSFFVPGVVALILVFVITAVAAYAGFSNIMIALTQPKSKYFLVPGMFIAAILLLAGFYYYAPFLLADLILSIVGSFCLIFGIFSLLIGRFMRIEETNPTEVITRKFSSFTCRKN
jgi:uncharacterized membrane protein HdeD (DUF308 family)